MKRRISRLTLAAFAAAGAVAVALPAASQISQTGGIREARLSGSCQSVDENESVTLSIGDARIRRGGTARVTGVRQSIVVEAGGNADVQGTGSTIYVMRGGQATVNGTRVQVVSENGGRVIVVGSAIMNVVEIIDLKLHPSNTACR